MTINSILRGRIKRVHFVGIGGIGMSGIAHVLLSEGFLITGSDLAANRETKNLETLGAKIYLGHDARHVEGADVLVFSSAIAPDNVEVKAARAHKIPVIGRAVMLAELMRLRCGIAVSGSHGKTTTTSLIGTLMHKVGLDPTVIIGGVVNHFGANAIVGQSQFMVAEADESDGTFLHLSPTIAVVTNIDAEHLDYYQGGIDEVREKFQGFLRLIPFYGLVVACIDDPQIKKLLPHLNRRFVTYGFDECATYCAKNVVSAGFSTTFDLFIEGRFVHSVTINMVGRHNVANNLAAIAVLEEVGVKSEQLMSHLGAFTGVKRRFMPVGSGPNFFVIDDYAHHPTEIKAVINAARHSFANNKIRVLFQPHRFSRTKDLMNEFSSCFAGCDSLVVTDIYSAQEKPIPGITSRYLVDRINEATGQDAFYAGDLEAGALRIASDFTGNDVVLTLGAGNVTNIGPKIVELLSLKEGPPA
jgi:UDP-N-acetylmuramate--alanine ligase